MLQQMPESVVNVSLFGSHGRGDNDEHSDVDVLVIVKDGSGTTPEAAIVRSLSPFLKPSPSVSFYGERKLRLMFEEGHLFAWHLYLESKGIGPFSNLSSLFAKPSDYAGALEDIADLITILKDVERQIKKCPHNSVFEMGILYVCARNIAMSASWHLASRPEFGRYSPYALSGLPFPLTMRQYDLAMQCRMASTRGISPLEVSADTVSAVTSDLIPWSASIMESVRAAQ